MTTYLSPIGYDSARVTRPVLSEGIDRGDTVVLLQPPQTMGMTTERGRLSRTSNG